MRLVFEPKTARHASEADIERIGNCARRCREAADWRDYEVWDNKSHHAIAAATHNRLLIYVFETVNVVLRSMVWGQSRGTRRPPRDYQSFGEHDVSVDAIARHEPDEAEAAMRRHLGSVYSRILPTLSV